MGDYFQIIVSTLVAGMAMPAGALVAKWEHIQTDWLRSDLRSFVMAFGGGALLSAVALVLVPEGAKELNLPGVVCCFAGGGLGFMLLDIILDRFRSPAGQLIAMLSDFLPEAIALGAAFAVGGQAGWLLAGLMALQNLPEGFNAYRELNASPSQGIDSKRHGNRTVFAFFLMALLGPVCGLIGYTFLAEQTQFVGGMMLFAGGGILYVVFQDVAPAAAQPKRWVPSMGCVLGFLLGLVGSLGSAP